MDAFEQLAAEILSAHGYWVRTSVKVDLTREDKLRIERQSSPRWEIDLVAYKPAEDTLLVLECKSYLDSGGVHAAHFTPGSRYAHRYKLFHDDILRETVLERLRLQMISAGLCGPETAVRLGLIYGHATSYNSTLIADHFKANDWVLLDPKWLNSNLKRMSCGSYENSAAALVSKLLLRWDSAPST
jgi:hypothetical protein